MTDELKPCPFCGSPARLNRSTGESLWSHDQVEWTQVQCTNEDCGVATENHCEGWEPTPIESWNSRALSASQPAQAAKPDLSGHDAFDVLSQGYPTHPADCRCEWCKGKPAAQATPDVPETDFGNKAPPELVTLGPLAKRNIYDAIRAAYDLGYNDARNARTVPGDSAPGYDGRSVEEDHGSALLNLLSKRLKPATPEPVGEAVASIYITPSGDREFDDWKHALPVGRTILYTRPAPGVPEGLPAVLTDWGFDVHDDEEGRTWLTIRNPDDDVARMSVPTVWPLNGNQTIGAVVLHQFSAALTSALAAAQAKGVW